MEIPVELFYLGALFFGVLAVHVFHRALREKERFHYIVGVLCLLALAGSLMLALNQVTYGGIFWLIAMILSVVMFPELQAYQDRRMGEVDVESPMRLGEFLFSNRYSGWLKLAHRHGLGITIVLFFLYFEALTAGMILALNLLYELPLRLFPMTLMGGATMSIILHGQIKRALTSTHQPTATPTES